VGTYTIQLGFNSTGNANLNYVYGNESQTQNYTLQITPKPIDLPYILNGDGLKDNGMVDGSVKTVEYTPDTTGRSMIVRGYNPDEMTYTWNGTTYDAGSVDEQGNLLLKLTAQNAGTYTVTFKIGSNYSWNSTGSTDVQPKSLTLRITAKNVATPVPTVTDGADWVSTVDQSAVRKDITLTYNGTQQGFSATVLVGVELGVGVSGTVTQVQGDDNLWTYTVLNAGTYYVRFYIANTTNYKWADGSTDTYRYIYIIVKPQTVSIPTLVVNDEYADATSRWDGAYKYVTYNTGNRYLVVQGFDSNLMTYSKSSALNLLASAGVEGGEGEDGETKPAANNYLTFYAVNATTYSVTFALTNTTNYIWETQNTNGQPVYLVIEKKRVAVPAIEGVAGNVKSVVYNGENQSMVLSPWDDNEVLLYDKTSSLSRSDTNANEFYAKNYLNTTGYMVRIRLTNYSNYQWADNGADDRYYYLLITPQAVDLPVIIEEDDKATATYDHSKGIKTVTFNTYAQSIKVNVTYGKAKVSSFTSGMSLKDDSNWASGNDLEYQATNSGTYTIVFALESANYKWKDDVAYNNTKQLQFVINKIKVTRPTIVDEDLGDNGTIVGNTKTVEYNAKTQYLNINAPFEFVTLTLYNA
ncbi:MAG: hypothetical protein K2L72_03045, partial [Clostridia bacterium]|nr:hypothetical protein [Clostridia bacterium]